MNRYLFHFGFTVLFLTIYTSSFSQPTFQSSKNTLMYGIRLRSLNPVGMVDVNGDLIDDIIILDRGSRLLSLISEGKHLKLNTSDTIVLPKIAWSMAAGDIDNDGTTEIITSGEYNGFQVSNRKENKWKTIIQNGQQYAQGSNTIDVDRDGWLDYFLCDDNAPPKVYMNDQKGKLIQKPVIDFMSLDPTDGSGNYASEWADVNGDFLPDLYLAKCRSGINDPNDQRRINRLYINDGNNNYVNMASEYQVDNGAQSWIGAIGDLNNDGFNDIFLANHYSKHIIYKNVNGEYFEEVDAENLVQNFPFQTILKDFDNDGYLDVIMAGIEGPFYLKNLGNFQFEYVNNVLKGSSSRSMTIGDVNDDGFLDVYSIQSEPINLPGLSDDELFINQGNANHFCKISLVGTQSNRSGIGAHISLYGDWGVQVRTLKGGESYGVVNSMQTHFGIGSATIIDSIVIRWPSGMIDRHTDLPIDQTLVIEEGKCITKQTYLAQEPLLLLDSLVFPTMENHNQYMWSNGSTEESISVSEVGSYHLYSRDAKGCLYISKPIIVRSGCLDTSTIDVFQGAKEINFCKGTSVNISAADAPFYLWSDGQTTKSITVTESGQYSCQISDLCGRMINGSIKLNAIDPSFTIKVDTVNKGEAATIISSSSSTIFMDFENGDPIAVGDTFVTPPLDTSKIFWAKNEVTIKETKNRVGQSVLPPISNEYGGNNVSGNLFFDVYKPIRINSILTKTDKPGIRKIVIRSNQVVATAIVDIKAGESRINLGIDLLPGSYSIETDLMVNRQNFGHDGPRLVRSIGESTYPYDIENVISIRNSIFGAQYYYYFYDWDITYDVEKCASDIFPITVVVRDKVDAIDDYINEDFEIFPNPVSADILILPSDNWKLISLVNVIGNPQPLKFRQQNEIDISALPSGTYFLHFYNDKNRITKAFVKF